MRSIVGHSSSLMRVKPSRPRCCADLEDPLLGVVEQLGRRAPAVERLGDDLGRDLDQAAEQRLLADDRAWYSTFAAVGTASTRKPMYSLPPAASSSPRRASSSASVSGSTTLAALGERDHRAEDPAMALAVEHRVVDELRRRAGSRPGPSAWRRAPPARRPPSMEDGGRGTGHARADGAIEYSTGELDIFPGGRFQAGFRSSAAGW